MVDDLRKVLLDIGRVVNGDSAVAVGVGGDNLIGRELSQIREIFLDLRHVVDGDLAVAVRVADEELAGVLPEGRPVGHFRCYLGDRGRPARERIVALRVGFFDRDFALVFGHRAVLKRGDLQLGAVVVDKCHDVPGDAGGIGRLVCGFACTLYP